LQLAFNPSAVQLHSADKGAAELTRLASVPSLARGGFFARLVRDLAAQELLAARTAA
jgi:hypothetical protein